MSKKAEHFLLILCDFVAINAAWMTYFLIRVNAGWFDLIVMPDFLAPMLIVYIYWFLVFHTIGLYRFWFAPSRFDELASIFKATIYGSALLFFLIFMDDSVHGVASGNRTVIVVYWALLFFWMSVSRLTVRGIQIKLLVKGIGRKNAIIIGIGATAVEVKKEIDNVLELGIDVIGFIDPLKNEEIVSKNAIPVIGTVETIERTIDEYAVKEIIFAFEQKHEDIVINVLNLCETKDIGLKIVPDLYEILSGQARSAQLYGSPLVDINPTIMPAWEQQAKRVMDFISAIILLVLSSPMIIITAIAIKLDSKGPVFYSQERCGINGKPFKILKFRSMRTDAEKQSGPVWSQKGDTRITRVGQFIRKVRIDELPQMWNVLKGEMSLIGPRPERPYFVEKLAKEIPYYKRRLRVRPGVTGWAQVMHKYDESFDDVKAKLKYDLFYIENMSLRMDFKILLRTVFVVLFGKGHYD
ncbi:MAG: sugar transferase [Ignavibacteriales bacterium]|nr:sugar transferase [Ignavibacteriales bacterium]